MSVNTSLKLNRIKGLLSRKGLNPVRSSHNRNEKDQAETCLFIGSVYHDDLLSAGFGDSVRHSEVIAHIK